MRDLLTEILVTVIGALILAFQRWKAARDFDYQRGQNQATRDLQAGAGVQTLAPPVRRRRRRSLGILPRAPTPLPFFPVAAAVPEHVETEKSQRYDTDRTKGEL